MDQVEIIPLYEDSGFDEEYIKQNQIVGEDGRLRLHLKNWTGTLVLPIGLKVSCNRSSDPSSESVGDEAASSRSSVLNDDWQFDNEDDVVVEDPWKNEHSSDESIKNDTIVNEKPATLLSSSEEKEENDDEEDELSILKTISSLTKVKENASDVDLHEQATEKPSSRWGATMTKISEHEMIVFGGEDDHGELVDGYLFSYDTKDISWTKVSNCSGDPVAWHTSIYLESSKQIVYFAGIRKGGETNDLIAFDCGMQFFYPLTSSGNAPTPRMGHTSCLVGKYMVTFGGFSKRRDLNDMFTLDTTNWRWCRPDTQGKPPSPRSFHTTTAVSDTEMFVIGGRFSDIVYNDVHILKLTEEGDFIWSSPIVTGPNFQPRCGHQAFGGAEKDHIVVLGGWDISRSDEDAVMQSQSLVLNVKESHWYKTEKVYPRAFENAQPKSGCSYAKMNDATILIFGGRINSQEGTDELLICNMDGTDTASLNSKTPEFSVTTPPARKRRRNMVGKTTPTKTYGKKKATGQKTTRKVFDSHHQRKKPKHLPKDFFQNKKANGSKA